jgi:hypothetical protein
VPHGFENGASCVPLVSADKPQQSEQQNPQLPHESSSTENCLNSEAADQRQQVTLISKMVILKNVIFEEYNQPNYLFMYKSVLFTEIEKKKLNSYVYTNTP